MSYLLLHNGNQLVKPWASTFYKSSSRLCLLDQWPDATDLSQKYQQAVDLDICTDLTSADVFDAEELFAAARNFKVIKVLTSYENDLANLEPVWNDGYSKSQWLHSSFFRLIFADKIVFQQPVVLECLETEPAIVFTPGRSGTHVLRDITGVTNCLHNIDDLLMQDQFSTVVNAKKILGILRKRFIDQVVSGAVAERYGIMLTTRNNFNENQARVSGWREITLSDSDYKNTLSSICNYADFLLGLKIFYNKKIEFSFLEDLHAHFDKISHVKNPYSAQQIISNYQKAVDTCQQDYQPIYNQIITTLERVLGTNLYNYD
jgi:hypothetical protein